MSAWETGGKSNEWYSPKYFFDAMQVEFDQDVASPVDRTYCCVPAKEFITENSLEKEWRGFVWMNPPFGSRNSIGLWLDKLYSHGSGIGLTPDRTSCPWWQKAAREANCVLLISRKVKFIRPDGTLGGSPSTGTSLFGYGKMAEMALINASSNGLGLLFKSVN